MYNPNYSYVNKEDKGKKVYKISHEYLVKTEQYIKADDADQAFDLWLEHGGIDYNEISDNVMNSDGSNVETDYVEAFTHGDHDMEYVGTVTNDPDDEYAEEDGNVIVNTDEPEKQPEKEREEVNA